MIILIRSILSADSQAAGADSNLLIQSGPGPFSNYQQSLGLPFLQVWTCLNLVISSSCTCTKDGLFCHPTSLSPPAKWHISLSPQAAGWVVDVECLVLPRAIAQALETESCAGLHWAGQGDFFSVSVWMANWFPSQKPDRMDDCPGSLETEAFV